jgi:putative heme-binding domain-containing protein
VRLAAEDLDAKVRLQAALTLGNWDDDESGRALAKIAGRSDNDIFTAAAIVSSALPHYPALCRVAIESPESARPIFDSLLKMGMARNRDDLAVLLDATLEAATGASGQFKLEAVDRLATWLESLTAYGETLTSLSSKNSPVGTVAIGTIGFIENVRRASIGSDSANSQAAACSLLGWQSEKYREDIKILASYLSPASSDEIQRSAVTALARIPDDAVAESLLNAWPQALPTARFAMADTLLSRTAWTKQMVGALENQSITMNDLNLSHRQRLTESRDAEIAQRSRKLLAGAEYDSNSPRADVVATFRSAVTTVGDAKLGEKLFNTNCQSCHTLDSTRQLIGPDLRSLTNRGPDALMTAILNPSESIDPRYTNYTVVLDSGQVFTGIVVMEDANSIELQTASGQREILARSAIEAIQQSRVSLMPDGFETKLDADEMSDLIAFLQSL